MKRLFASALLLTAIAYPFGVYFSLGRISAAWVALGLALLWLLRALTSSASNTLAPRLSRPLPFLMVFFCLGLAAADLFFARDTQIWLRVYPVLVNTLFLTLFGLSLKFGLPIIEQIARLRYADLPPQAVRYTRKVTMIWCLFFAVNGSIAAALAFWGTWAWWAIYNGAISYVLMGTLLLGEWWLRPKYRKE
ncbi:hypothetical protein AXK11_03495 [Cephaloticoccus primus]|uniref:DNA gyrase subunit B n=1 Tax=Cephaloticoccus primus TaxID=1548207 RepID=A0A139SQP7_9BACT|nr:hypothetical protein [Cephaloticoccus primus]KXU36863.1 hypothetical protein AXK11_03495 [Cephaloticoccus primus]